MLTRGRQGTWQQKVELIAMDEMRPAEMFAERIKELDGEPTTEPSAKVERGQHFRVIFSFDADLEDNAIDAYNQFLLVKTSQNLFYRPCI